MVREGSGESPGVVFPARGSCASWFRAGENLPPSILEENLESWICLLVPKKEEKNGEVFSCKKYPICNISFFFFNLKQQIN